MARGECRSRVLVLHRHIVWALPGDENRLQPEESLANSSRIAARLGAGWSRSVVVALAAGALAYGGTRLFGAQPAVGAPILGALAMAAALTARRPGPALVVGVVAALWNDVVGLPHALAGFLGPALVIELWAMHLRAGPRKRLGRRVATDLILIVVTLGSPVAIGFAAGPGYVDLDDIVEFRHYLIDLTAIGLAYLAVLGAAVVPLVRWARGRRIRRLRRRAYSEEVMQGAAESR